MELCATTTPRGNGQARDARGSAEKASGHVRLYAVRLAAVAIQEGYDRPCVLPWPSQSPSQLPRDCGGIQVTPPSTRATRAVSRSSGSVTQHALETPSKLCRLTTLTTLSHRLTHRTQHRNPIDSVRPAQLPARAIAAPHRIYGVAARAWTVNRPLARDDE